MYDNEVVTDRRTKAITPGTVATLEDHDRRAIATVTVNPNSRLFCRVLDRDPGATIDGTWIVGRVAAAMDLRQSLYPEPFYRLIHGEADGLPGLIVDRFGDVLAIQPNSAWADAAFDDIAGALSEVTGAGTVIRNGSSRSRALEGLDDTTSVVRGTLDGPVEVPMNGAVYMADLLGGQKTGLFYDQRDNHGFFARHTRGARILDVFSHVGGFSLAALANGATKAVAVDGSEAALSLARQGAERSGFADCFETKRGDAFEVMASIRENDEYSDGFDAVVCDPPAFAPHKGALDAGLRAYEKVARLAAPLVVPGGTLTLCSCSQAADLDKFRAASIRGIGRAGRSCQILRTGFAGPDHPQHPHMGEAGYLKAITFRLLP